MDSAARAAVGLGPRVAPPYPGNRAHKPDKGVGEVHIDLMATRGLSATNRPWCTLCDSRWTTVSLHWCTRASVDASRAD